MTANEGLKLLRASPSAVRAAVAATDWIPQTRQEAVYVGDVPDPHHTQPIPSMMWCWHPRDGWLAFSRPQKTYEGWEYQQMMYRCRHCLLEFPVRSLPYAEN